MSTENVKTKELVIARTFNAPRALVWKAFTEAEHLAQWWGPKGSEIKVNKLQFQPGGIFLYSMEMAGKMMWGRFIYKEIIAPEKIIFINSFSDENGGITANPWFPGPWPLEIMNTVLFTEENGKTTITLHGGPINATEEEHAAFVNMMQGMNAGFKGTFDQLDEYLAKMQA